MTLAFELENVYPIGIPINPNINIELDMFQSVPYVDISEIIKYHISILP
jgi:hypothetical protein